MCQSWLGVVKRNTRIVLNRLIREAVKWCASLYQAPDSQTLLQACASFNQVHGRMKEAAYRSAPQEHCVAVQGRDVSIAVTLCGKCHWPSVQASDRQTLLQACASFKQAHGDMKEAAQAWQQLRRVAASKAVKQQALAGLVACTATWDPGKGQGMCTRCFGSPVCTAVTAITWDTMSASWCVREMDLIAAPPSGCSEVAGAGWLVCWWGRHGAVSCHRSVCENR